MEKNICPVSNMPCKETKSHQINEVVDGEVTVYHLCARCAYKFFVDEKIKSPKKKKIFSFFNKILKPKEQLEKEIVVEDTVQKHSLENQLNDLNDNLKNLIKTERFETANLIHKKILAIQEILKKKQVLEEQLTQAVLTSSFDEAKKIKEEIRRIISDSLIS